MMTVDTDADGVDSRPLDVRGLHEVCRRENRPKLFDEFNNMPTMLLPREAVVPGTNKKNRYIDVLPNHETRVMLTEVPEGSLPDANPDEVGPVSTYINANYVGGYGNTLQRFIAAMGPLPNTTGDFWRMIWEQECRIIAMMTGIVEKRRQKCHKYWPDDGEEHEHGFFKIVQSDVVDYGQYVLTTLEVTDKRSGQTRTVKHFWFTGWPDHGVPDETHPVINFVLAVRKHAHGNKSPIVVHCSAGIGRTGTFVAIDIGMDELHNEWRVVDVAKIVRNIREQRGGSVQTFEQYEFIYKALRDFVTPGFPVSMFGKYLPRDVAMIKSPGQTFGLTLRGSYPAFVLKLEHKGLAMQNGIKLGDHVLAVNQEDVSKHSHKDVVESIRQAGDVVVLTVISKELI